MDLDAEVIRIRSLAKKMEPVIADYEARQGDGMGTPKGYTVDQWADMFRVYDRLGALETRLAPWDQVEGENIPPGIQDLAKRLIERVDRIEAKLGDVDRLSAELTRMSRMMADLAEIVENKAPLEPLPRHDNGAAAIHVAATQE